MWFPFWKIREYKEEPEGGACRFISTETLAKLGAAAGRKQMSGINKGQDTTCEEAGGRGKTSEIVTFPIIGERE